MMCAGSDLAPPNEALLTQQGGCVAFEGQATLFRHDDAGILKWVMGNNQLQSHRWYRLAVTSTARARLRSLITAAAVACCGMQSNGTSRRSHPHMPCCSTCRHRCMYRSCRACCCYCLYCCNRLYCCCCRRYTDVDELLRCVLSAEVVTDVVTDVPPVPRL